MPLLPSDGTRALINRPETGIAAAVFTVLASSRATNQTDGLRWPRDRSSRRKCPDRFNGGARFLTLAPRFERRVPRRTGAVIHARRPSQEHALPGPGFWRPPLPLAAASLADAARLQKQIGLIISLRVQ